MRTATLLAALVLVSAAGAAAQQPRGVVGAYTALRIWPQEPPRFDLLHQTIRIRFDAPSGAFDSCEYWNNGATAAHAPAMELSLNGLLVGGSATDASGSWNALTGSSATLSLNYSPADGTGGDAGWTGIYDPGSVGEASFSGVLDSGDGTAPDALMLRRSIP